MHLDRADTDPEIQRNLFARQPVDDAKTIEVNASHVAYMSYPKETTKLIEEASTSVHVNE